MDGSTDSQIVGYHIETLEPVLKAAPPALTPKRADGVADADASQAKKPEDVASRGILHEIPPPYDLTGLCAHVRKSTALRPCIDAYRTLIAGFGWDIKPILDLTGPQALARVREELVADRRATRDPTPITDEEVAQKKAWLEEQIATEAQWLRRWLDNVGVDKPLTQIRKERDQDRETCGGSYWEVLRRADGSFGYVVPIQASSMRVCKLDDESTLWKRRERQSLFTWDEVEIPWRFHSYVQIGPVGQRTYFSEFGDRRPRDPRTGRLYPLREGQTVDELREELKAQKRPIANEVIYWRLYDPDTPYGIPRWIAAQFASGAILESEQVVYYYYDGRAIPPGLLCVSGGKFRADANGVTAAKKIEQMLVERAAGRSAFYSMAVIEADVGTGNDGSKCRITYIPLGGEKVSGAFLDQQRADAIKVQQQFRLPDLLTGRSQEVNKAQAEAALGFAEQQVIQPLREDEDGFWNRRIFPDLGVQWHEFHTNSAVASDPAQMADLIVKAAQDLTPGEKRPLWEEVFNKKFEPIHADWTKQPPAYTLAGIPVQEEPTTGQKPAPTLTPITSQQAADTLQRAAAVAAQLRATQAGATEAADRAAIADAQKDRANDTLLINIDVDSFKSLVDEDT